MSSNPFDFNDDDDDRKKSKGRRRDRDEEEDDRPRSKRRRDDDEEEDDRRRSPARRRDRDEDDEEDDRRRSAARRRARDEEEDDEDEDEDEDDYRGGRPRRGHCPKCGNNRSTKVSYTWWGGVLGPALFSMVQCTRCKTQYNKNTGKRVGAGPIAIYSVVIVVLFGGLILAIRLAAN